MADKQPRQYDKIPYGLMEFPFKHAYGHHNILPKIFPQLA